MISRLAIIGQGFVREGDLITNIALLEDHGLLRTPPSDDLVKSLATLSSLCERLKAEIEARR